MADSALERYLKDKQLEEQTPPGKNRSIEELKESFQTTLENLTEPTAPVKYLRPLKPRKKEDGTLRDTSALILQEGLEVYCLQVQIILETQIFNLPLKSLWRTKNQIDLKHGEVSWLVYLHNLVFLGL
jgi:hypothetical protein